MLRSIATVVLVGGALFGAPELDTLDPVLSALVAVVAGSLLATMALGALSPSAVALGAAGALAHAALAPLSIALAGGALFAFVFTARAVRARTPFSRSLTLALGVVGGAVGTTIAVAYAGDAVFIRVTAIVVGALVATAAMLVPIDDPVAWALRDLSDRTTGPLRWRLLRAVALRRRHVDLAEGLSRTVRRKLERAWRGLVRAARTRVESPGGARDALELRVVAYVRALGRVARAAADANALSADMDDAVLAELKLARDDIEARAHALAEVGGATNREAA